MMKRRVALYGGTFDPVHVGHLAVARSLLKLFALDEVLFIPAHIAPHKRDAAVTPALFRYAMLALATADDDALCVSAIELEAPTRPYTVETLSRLEERMENAELFFVMGLDSWEEITTWREWGRVLTLTNHIVMARPGYEWNTSHVTPEIQKRIVDLRGMNEEDAAQKVESGTERIYWTDQVVMDVSATMIRRAIRERREEEAARLLTPQVAKFIEKYKLYKERHETEHFDQRTGAAS